MQHPQDATSSDSARATPQRRCNVRAARSAQRRAVAPFVLAQMWRRSAAWRASSVGINAKAMLASERLPLALLGALLLLGLVTVLTQAHNYGIALDEQSQERLGRHLLAWYGTLGRDTSFLTAFPASDLAPQHGGIFDTFVAAVQYVLPHADPWLVRHILTGLAGLGGVVAIALCGYELGGAWIALLAALGLWLYPHYYGAIYNNPKDVPATVTLTFVLWATLVLVKQWKPGDRSRWFLRNGLVLGFCLGVAAAVRVNALIWYAVLAALVGGYWLLNGRRLWRAGGLGAELGKQAVTAGVIGITSWATMAALWPYVFLNPVGHLYDAIQVMSHYPWDGLVVFGGTAYPAAQLSGSYLPTWLIIGSPPALIVLALLGFAVACAISRRARQVDPAVATVALAFVVPFASLLVLHPVLYDGLRQFLFLIPPLILMAAYGLVRTVTSLARQPQQVLRLAAGGLVVAVLVSYILVIAEMAAISPFEYTYFSPVVGGLPGADGKYDIDYWATCSKQSADWLARNYRRYTHTSAPTVSAIGAPFQFMVTPYLPPAFQPEETHPDFFIASTRVGQSQHFPTYGIIHTVSVEGVALCVVKINPALVTNASG